MINCLKKLNLFQIQEGEGTESNSGEVKLFQTRFTSDSVTIVKDSEYEFPQFLKTYQLNPLARSFYITHPKNKKKQQKKPQFFFFKKKSMKQDFLGKVCIIF